MPRVSSDILLALAYVSRISDPDELRSRFFESLAEIDPGRSFSYLAEAAPARQGAELLPISTMHSSFGYALVGGAAAEPGMAVFRNAFQFLAVLLENRVQARALLMEKASLEHEAVLRGAELREQEERYRNIFENKHVVMLILDPDEGRILDANLAAVDFYGYPKEELLAMKISELNAQDEAAVAERLKLVRSKQMEFYGLQHKRADGSVRDVEIYTGPVLSAGTTVIFSIVHDVTERLEASAGLSRSLAEKDVLLRELHHRVKNNLQIISSMLSLQMEGSAVSGLQAEFVKAQNRIYALALLHERLYQSEHLDRLDLGGYLKSILRTVVETSRHGSGELEYEADIEDIELDLDKAIPCGLIVNELVTNVVKHAFDGRGGHFALVVRRIEGGRISLCISDDGLSGRGPPLPGQRHGGSAERGIGLQLVEALVSQLDGSLRFERRKGTLVEVVFPEA
jgi:PAS domain S-box-containing protein